MKNKILLFSLMAVFLLLHNKSLMAQQNNEPEETETQKPKKNQCESSWNLDFLGTVDFPMADMAKRYGTSYRIGLGIKHITKNRWITGVRFEFITGNKFKEDSLLINLKTEQGSLINQSGDLLHVGKFERGYTCGIQVGRIFPVYNINKNSGPMWLGSLGFIQHKINFFDRNNSFPQLRDEYKKGYDRLSNGMYIENFLGYTYFSKNKSINFYAGFNFLWGFTKVRRNYTFDLQRAETNNRNDILMGFKVGWVLPIYKKNTEETYY